MEFTKEELELIYVALINELMDCDPEDSDAEEYRSLMIRLNEEIDRE